MSILIENVTKHFGQKVVLDNINLEIKTGSLVALLGGSGSGKSTLLRVVAGFEEPTTGRVWLNGRDSNILSIQEKEIGFVFQAYALFQHLTVYENIAFGLSCNSSFFKLGFSKNPLVNFFSQASFDLIALFNSWTEQSYPLVQKQHNKHNDVSSFFPPFSKQIRRAKKWSKQQLGARKHTSHSSHGPSLALSDQGQQEAEESVAHGSQSTINRETQALGLTRNSSILGKEQPGLFTVKKQFEEQHQTKLTNLDTAVNSKVSNNSTSVFSPFASQFESEKKNLNRLKITRLANLELQEINLKKENRKSFVPLKDPTTNVVKPEQLLSNIKKGAKGYVNNNYSFSNGNFRSVEELLRLVGLEELAHRYPNQLSGGQCQRVALARALAVQPKVLLLDEPFGALDTKVRKNLRRWLRQLHERVGVTTLFVTHDHQEAMEVANEIVVLEKGRVKHSLNSPQKIFSRLTNVSPI